MFDLKSSLSAFMAAVIGSIFIFGILVEEKSIGTSCAPCNTSYSVYIQFLRLQLCFMLFLDKINSSKLMSIKKMIRSLEKSLSVLNTEKQLVVLPVFVVFITGFRFYIDVRCDIDFPWSFHLTQTLSSLYTLAFTVRFNATLTLVREVYIRLREKVECANDGCWTSDPPKMLKVFLAMISRTLRIHERVDDVFGMEIFLIQFAAVSGFCINTYLLAYINLMQMSSLWINIYFILNDIECGVVVCSYALIGQSTYEAAKDVMIEICRTSFSNSNRNFLDQVRYFIHNCIREPVHVTAMAFYPLTKESLFNIVTTMIAFLFVSLQFNSLNSKFDIDIV